MIIIDADGKSISSLEVGLGLEELIVPIRTLPDQATLGVTSKF